MISVQIVHRGQNENEYMMCVREHKLSYVTHPALVMTISFFYCLMTFSDVDLQSVPHGSMSLWTHNPVWSGGLWA